MAIDGVSDANSRIKELQKQIIEAQAQKDDIGVKTALAKLNQLFSPQTAKTETPQGTSVEHANDDAKARSAEARAQNARAKQEGFENITKQLIAAAFCEDQKQIDKALENLNNFRKNNPDFKPEEQAANKSKGPMKFRKVRTINSKYYTVDIYDNGKAIYSPNVPTEKQKVRSKKEIRSEVKQNARFKDENGLVSNDLKDKDGNVCGKANLEKAREQVKKKRNDASDKLKDLSGKYNEARRDYYKLRRNKASKEELKEAENKYKTLGKQMSEAVKANQDASEAYVETNRALKTARGNGTRKISRKERNIAQSENKVAERSHVYATKAEQNQATSENKDLKGHVGHLDQTGTDMLLDLQILAMRRLEDSGIKLNNECTAIEEGQKFTQAQQDVVQKWGDIVQIQIPGTNDSADVVEEKTRSTQKALKALAGMDNTIDPTEKKTILQELKTINSERYSGLQPKGLRTELNKLYDTYGLENQQRLRYKFMDVAKGLAGNAAPAIAAGTLAYFKELTVTARAIATATATAIATATATAHIDEINECVEDVATAVAHAEASTPGFNFTYLDPETQEEIIKRVAGQYNEQTVQAVAKAIAQIHVDAVDVTETTTAISTATSTTEKTAQRIKNHDWKEALKATGTVLVVGAAIDFLTSKGNEHGVGTNAEEYKDAQFINMHKGTAAKAEAQNIIQLRKELAAKMGGTPEDHAQANQMVVGLYKQSDGVQNGVMKMEELTGVRVALADIVAKYEEGKPVPPPPQPTPTTPQTTPPTPQPTPLPKKEYHGDGNIIYKVERGDVLSNIVRAKYPKVNPTVAMKAIAKANRLKDLNSLRTGQILELPDIDGVKADEAAQVKKAKGGKKIIYNPTKTDAQERGTVYIGKEHEGSHDGEQIVETFTGTNAKKRALKRAEELNNQ